MLTDDRLVCGYNNVMLLQDFRGHITIRAVVNDVTQDVWHTVISNLLFPVGKHRKRDN
jgi:hypothetical protein